MKRLLRNVVDHPILTIVLVLVITGFFASRIPSLRFHTSIYDLTIEDLPQNVAYQDFKKQFGSEEIIAVVAHSDNFFEKKSFDELETLAGKLSEIKGVRRVVSLPGIKKSIDITNSKSIAEFEQIIAPADLLVRTVISPDKKTSVITIILEDLADKEPVIVGVRSVIKDVNGGKSIYQIGLPLVAEALADYTTRDFLTLPPIAFLVIAVVLVLLFRSVRGVLVPVTALAVALVWTFGLMAMTGAPLAMLTMIVPVFLIAVGTAYCMHVFAEYRTEAAQSETPAEAAFKSVAAVGFPTTLAVVTTTIGLCSLLVNKITAIRDFAIYSAAGIIIMLILLLTLTPAILALLPIKNFRRTSNKRKSDFLDAFLARVANINIKKQKILLPAIGLVSLVAIAGITMIKVENNPVDYFKPDTPVSRHFHDISKDMSGSIPLNVVVDSKTDEYFQNPSHLADLIMLQEFLITLDGVDKTESFADYLMLVNYAKHQYQPEYYNLPEENFEVRMLTNNFQTVLGKDLYSRFMDPDFSKANIVMRTHIASSRDCLEVERKINEFVYAALSRDLNIRVTGFSVVMAHSSHLLTSGQVQSLSTTLVLVFGIMFLLFLSAKVGLIAMVPNFFPIVMNFGIMGWLGMELSAVTSLIASVAIGLAVDDTIHYLFRYNREFKKDLDKHRAMRSTIDHVGRPIIFTTLTISLGFAVLLFSSFKPTTAFGLMMVITMVSALVGDLFLLPALMLHMELVTIWDLLRLKLGKDPQEGIPLFKGLSRSQVHYVLMAGTLKGLHAGDALFHKGEMSDSMYAIVSGDVDVLDYVEGDEEGERKVESGPSRLVARLKRGDVVGEMGLVRSCERTATVVARGPVELLEVNKAMIKRLTWLYPPTAQRFFFNLMAELCNRLEDTTSCLSRSTTTDFLTGLYYRGYFLEELEKEVYRSGRYENPLCLIMADLKNYETLCREYGELAGERVLAELGKVMRDELRCSDMACRWGVHQFSIMLANTSEEEAIAVTDRLAELMDEMTFQFDSTELRLETNIALTTLPPGEKKEAAELMRLATLALVQSV